MPYDTRRDMVDGFDLAKLAQAISSMPHDMRHGLDGGVAQARLARNNSFMPCLIQLQVQVPGACRAKDTLVFQASGEEKTMDCLGPLVADLKGITRVTLGFDLQPGRQGKGYLAVPENKGNVAEVGMGTSLLQLDMVGQDGFECIVNGELLHKCTAVCV
eukprot:scaffold245450_cov17-Tisochrysis_lutea.AAC.1